MDRLITVMPLKSFDSFREGVEVAVWMSEPVAHLIVNGYLRLLYDPMWELTRVVHTENQ